MSLRTGIDLIEIERVEAALRRHGLRLLQRIFTPNELADLSVNNDFSQQVPSIAARFAAKEAVAKALGTGIGIVKWHDIEVMRGPSGEPILHLGGSAEKLASELGLTAWSLSLSHTRTHAIAMVVAV